MTLPKTFIKSEQYFEECISFFKEYQHLYNFANTDILVNEILNRIHIENLQNTNVFDKDFQLSSLVERDQYLRDFFAKLERLEYIYDEFIDDDDLEDIVGVPLSPKKRHEIVYLTKEITKTCEEAKCGIVVDFGSGLGYLDQLIFETANYKVLGLECNENHYVGAKKRQRTYHVNSKGYVKYIKHTVTEDSQTQIEDYLKDKFLHRDSFCITGLHACADLTVDAVNLFLKMADARALVLMPCCYHKMKSNEIRFKNFPLSKCLKEIYEKYNGFEYLKTSFLRLAAQPPSDSDNSLEDLVFYLLSRAVLQLYAYRHNCKLKRTKRKAVKVKTVKDFESYTRDACTNGFKLLQTTERPTDVTNDKNVPILKFDLEEITSIWRKIEELTFKKAAIFILLQNHLQPVFENFILYDRLMYLKENGVKNCIYKKIVNEKISPKSLALIAFK